MPEKIEPWAPGVSWATRGTDKVDRGENMVKEAEFLEILTKIFQAELDDPNIAPDMSKTQSDVLEWDSLAHVRIILAVERTFNVQFDVNEIEKIDSVRGIFDAVGRHNG